MKTKIKTCYKCEKETYYIKLFEGKRYCEKCILEFKPKKKIKKRSNKQIAKDEQYSTLRKDYLSKNEMCEAALPGCSGKAIEIHHKSYRGVNQNDEETWIGICRSCHNFIHANPKIAREKGLLN